MKTAVLTALLACTSALAATPSAAQPLPDGEYMLGTYIWPDTHLPRYVTLLVYDPYLSIEFSSAIPMNSEVCAETGGCWYSVIGASARVDAASGTLDLSEIGISLEAARLLDDGGHGAAYIEPLLALIDGATIAETDTGLTLTQSGQTLEFFETDADTRDAIRAYPITMNVSIIDMGFCDVRTLAPLLMRDASTPFANVLQGMAHQAGLQHQIEQLGFYGTDVQPEVRELVFPIQRSARMPNMLAARGFDATPTGIDAFWEDMGDALYRGDRAAFDATMAGYGDSFTPLIDFMHHLRDIGGPAPEDQVCDDLSFGFIAAQDG
ncbi:hypothetical protein HKCCE4037_08960 [Rhodobacterales bacterium HKCCE4037]|nr:hypothetical protein [Rhodobacterales bacterium HKCCE4037]